MLDRNLYKINDNQSAIDQTMGNRTQIDLPNINQPDYYKTSSFPQPGVIGMGYVNANETKGSFFFPSAWTLPATHVTTGVYTITHNIGQTQASGTTINRYLPIINLIGSTDKSFAVTVGATTTTVYTFNQAGTATDTAFMFVFYLIS